MTRRPEDVCLTCRLPAKRCNGGDKNCPFGKQYPGKKDWRGSVIQDVCGVREQPEKGVTCR